MFAKKITESDAFVGMPSSTQCYYFHLCQNADDEGFVNSPLKVMDYTHATRDDFNILVTKKFIIPFDNGIVVIKHWLIHNLIRNDRLIKTEYTEEKEMLQIEDNKYKLIINDNQVTTKRQPSDNQKTAQVRLSKDSLVKESIEIGYSSEQVATRTPKCFTKPSVEEVSTYCQERKNNVNPQRFVDFYTSNGWKVGRNSMKDWRACVRTWERTDKNPKKKSNGSEYEGLV